MDADGGVRRCSKCELCTGAGAKLFETNPDAREVRPRPTAICVSCACACESSGK